MSMSGDNLFLITYCDEDNPERIIQFTKTIAEVTGAQADQAQEARQETDQEPAR